MTPVLVTVCTGLAVLVVAYASAGALWARTPLARLHFLAPVTTLAVPLFSLGAMLTFGWSLASATIAVTALVMAVSGPALTVAIGRAIAAEAGLDVGQEPE